MPRMEIYRRFGFDKWLFLTTLILIMAGLVMVFSSSGNLAAEQHNNSLYFFIHQLIGAGAGLMVILIIMSIEKPFYQNSLFIYGLLTLTLGMLALCLLMPAIGNTNRWIQFFGIRFQPSELAKISLVLFFAYYLDKKKDKMHDLRTLVFPLCVLFIFILLIIKEPDYGTAFFIFLACAITLFVGGVKLHYFLLMGFSALALFAVYLLQAPYRMDRISAFISPTTDLQGLGFQAFQSKMALGSGGIFGVSIGESTQKLFFLPCAHTDYIYAIIGEELGLMGTIGVLILFAIVLWRGIVISKRAPNLFSQMLAAGLTLAISAQALMNISIVLGLGPTTGLPLPLISYGRSSLITTLFAIGILLHISQRKTSQRKK